MMKEKYDMILFEHLHSATNHRKDVFIIAELLKSRGWNVAVLDLYNDLKSVTNSYNIKVLALNYKGKFPSDKLAFPSSNMLCRCWENLKYVWMQYNYMKNVRKEIEEKASMFYIGSYLFFPTFAFFSLRKPCFYWGLRSNLMLGFLDQLKSHLRLQAPYLQFAKKMFLKNKYQYLFVSNPIIKNEFINNGIPADRLIIREERPYHKKIVEREYNKDGKTVFLVIGTLRKEKNILKTIQAFKQANISNASLKLVGKCKDEGYEKLIESAINGESNIVRINNFLSEEEFQQFFMNADYVVFADEQGTCCITNGTMQEAFIHRVPIIAPNYHPYSYYFAENKVGILYNPEHVSCLSDAFKKASDVNPIIFKEAIERHLNTIEFHYIAEYLDKQLSNLRK